MFPANRFLLALILLAAPLPACATADTGDASSDQRDEEATGSWSSSLAVLADSRVPKTWDTVAAGVSSLSTSTLPHEAKTLRKQIGELRDYIDLFASVYDKKGPGDPWVDLRDDLDEGYETVGAFKDLFDAQGLTLKTKDPATGQWTGEGVLPEQVTYPDASEVEKRRSKVLSWKTKLESKKQVYRDYIAHADAQKLHDHGASEQSQFFWAGAGLSPDKDKSGLENLSALSRELLDRGRKDYGQISGLKEVTSFDDHEQFHNLRKRIRAIVKVVDYFPALLEPGADEPLNIARQLVDRYGSLNDKITAFDLEKKKSKKKELGDEIEDEWNKLRKWQSDQDVDHQIETLKKRIRKHG